MLDAGIAVGVGTDSELSVGDLDLFAEARTARALAGLSAPETLGLMTRSAARAIGMTGEVGELTVAAWGDVIALDLGEVTAAGQVEEVVLAAGPASVRGTWIGGRQVHRRS
jgi:cytosine/adenosine deaminase-related metal-dependent hydrolase